MFERRSLKWPVTLGVLMIVSVIALTVGWVLLSTFGAVKDSRWSPLYWTLLTVGTAFLTFVFVGVVMYLRLTVETINLNRRQSNFIDSVTHELKSPIASLKLYLQTLERLQVSPEEQQNFVRFMLDDVERLDTLINHLLDAARLDHRVVEAEREDIRLAEALALCVEAVCLRYRLSPSIVRLQVPPISVRARPLDIDLVFRNLIDNAVKYAGNEPDILISGELTADQRAIIRISDNGRGIPAPLRRRIFGRFFRMGEELERDKPGLGLGLYLVRTTVRRLKGKVRVRDREGGTGTTFEVILPACSASVAAAEAAQRQPSASFGKAQTT